VNKVLKTADLFTVTNPLLLPYFEKTNYPWELLPQIKTIIRELIPLLSEGWKQIGEEIWVGEGVSIAPTAVLEGPAIIGKGTQIRPGAYIRGNVLVGSDCVIGNSTELKNCILLDGVQVPHYNYVGDSILGNKAHMGAGSICSNLKSDKSNVIIHSDPPLETGLRKVGSFLGDSADIGCGSVLNPGTVIGPGSRVYPLCSLRGVYPEGCIVKDTKTVVPFEER
jgi:NDP-sugar pyrophosphorylase family protein